MAGWPVMLATTAGYSTVRPPRSAARIGSSGVEAISPSRAGGVNTVGINQRSKPVRNSAIRREKRGTHSIASRYAAAETRSPACQ
jgi:hypothetical protein